MKKVKVEFIVPDDMAFNLEHLCYLLLEGSRNYHIPFRAGYGTIKFDPIFDEDSETLGILGTRVE